MTSVFRSLSMYLVSFPLGVPGSTSPAFITAQASSCGPPNRQPQLGDRALAHDEFLDLAGDGHREFVDELDVARHLVVGDAIAAEGLDLLLVDVFARTKPDPGAYFLAVAVVGHADHLHVLDFRMAVEKLLDLARIDVLAAADDHVLDAPDDVAIAFRVDGGEVAGVHPARRIDGLAGALRIVPIAEHHRIAAREELAGRAGRHDPALRVDDLDLQMRLDAADGRHAALERIVGRALKAHRARLGHAVRDSDLRQMHLVDRALHHLDRARRAGHDG